MTVPTVRATGAWLHADGLRPGGRIALWAPNLPPFAAFALAAMQVGAAVTTLNPAAVDREVGSQLRDAGVATIVTVPALVGRARSLGLRRVIALGDGHGDGAVPLRDGLATTDPPPVVDVDPPSGKLQRRLLPPT
jgi:long-chain acyl-CoA synthetase